MARVEADTDVDVPARKRYGTQETVREGDLGDSMSCTVVCMKRVENDR